MTWQEAVATVVILLGLGAGAYMVAQRPSFWIEFGARLLRAVMPSILKRMDPADEQRWRDAVKRGEEWDYIRNRPKRD